MANKSIKNRPQANILASILIAILAPISIANAENLSIQRLEHSLNTCYPKILNAALQQEINQAKAKQNMSPFDTKFNAYANQRAGSTYNTSYQKVEFEKRFYDLPIAAYTGFDISTGYTPQYDSAQITSTQGRQFIGLKFNLLSGFAIDKDRLSLYNSILETDKAKYEIELTKLVIKTDAIKSYITWVITGSELKAYQKLLLTAEKRQKALEKRLQSGDISAIAVKENYNYILKRKIKVMSAQDYFNQSALALSLYYRDNACNTIKPAENLLPKELPKDHTLSASSDDIEINEAIRNRPEFKVIETQLAQIRNQQKLAKTELLPKLNLALQYNQNNSSTATTSYFIINQQEGVAKAEFSLPLDRSYGTGLDEETTKNLVKLQNERQLLVEQIASRVKSLHYTVSNTAEQISLAQNEFSLSNELLKAENNRIMNGDSNFFMLNAREENATNSYLSLLGNLSDNYKAMIEYNFLNGKNVNLNHLYTSH